MAATAATTAVLAADNAHAQAMQSTPEKSLYERLGGVFAIAAVVDYFSGAVVKTPIVGQNSKNPQLREWNTKNLERLPARLLVGPSSSRPPSPARRRWALRRRTETADISRGIR